MPRRSADQVAEGRQAILSAATAEASVRGFRAASIGRLADQVGMSKSGLVRHFGDKEGLQLAALEAGVERFIEDVWAPAAEVPRGYARLVALCDAWLEHHRHRTFPGGCLLTTAAVEFDAQPGPVRDAAADALSRWLSALKREAEIAVADGDLPEDTDPADLAFALNALAAQASIALHLFGDEDALARARRLMHALLDARP
jgi:AcrR family transcriptional regulator